MRYICVFVTIICLFDRKYVTWRFSDDSCMYGHAVPSMFLYTEIMCVFISFSVCMFNSSHGITVWLKARNFKSDLVSWFRLERRLQWELSHRDTWGEREQQQQQPASSQQAASKRPARSRQAAGSRARLPSSELWRCPRFRRSRSSKDSMQPAGNLRVLCGYPKEKHVWAKLNVKTWSSLYNSLKDFWVSFSGFKIKSDWLHFW